MRIATSTRAAVGAFFLAICAVFAEAWAIYAVVIGEGLVAYTATLASVGLSLAAAGAWSIWRVEKEEEDHE